MKCLLKLYGVAWKYYVACLAAPSAGASCIAVRLKFMLDLRWLWLTATLGFCPLLLAHHLLYSY